MDAESCRIDQRHKVMSDQEDQQAERGPVRRGTHTKGRGFRAETSADDEDRYAGSRGNFESVDTVHAGVQKSVEGFVVFVTGLHEEATEEDVHQHFGEFGSIQQLHLNLDRRTGFAKGYSLIEYKTYEEAAKAVQEMDGASVMEQKVNVGWAFKPTPAGSNARGGMGRGGGRGGRQQRPRSQSPQRR